MKTRLPEWQNKILPYLREHSYACSEIADLTVLSYFFWNDDRINSEFWRIECAFLCAFRTLGLLPSVLVVNRTTTEMMAFCRRYDIDVQVEGSLTNGLPSMSLDCIRRLHRRFATDNVLVVQNDGFPVGAGIEAFLGRYDYVGAPWPGHTRHLDFFPYPKYGVGNGGFSLRSKRICRMASDIFLRRFKHLPMNWFFTEDVFYCKTMRFLSKELRESFAFPSREEALGFSMECEIPSVDLPKAPPVGFHSQGGFSEYCAHYGIPFGELLDEI